MMHMGNMTKDFVPVGKEEQAEIKVDYCILCFDSNAEFESLIDFFLTERRQFGEGGKLARYERQFPSKNLSGIQICLSI